MSRKKLRDKLRHAGKAIFRIVHFGIRLVLRVIVLVVMTVLVIAPLMLLGLVLLFPNDLMPILRGIWDWITTQVLENMSEPEKYSSLRDFGATLSIDGPTIMLLVSALIGVLGSTLLVKFFEDIRLSIISIWEKIKDVLHEEWVPGPEISRSLKTTRQQIVRARPKIREAHRSSWILAVAIVMVTVIWALVYLQVKQMSDWQKKVIVGLDAVEERLERIENQFPLQPAPGQEKRPIVYSFSYLKNGSLKTMEGICPDSANFAWLEALRASISECSTEASRIEVELKAFASIAPGDVPDISELPERYRDSRPTHIRYSDWYNLEVANQRGKVVEDILTSENTSVCKERVANASGGEHGKEDKHVLTFDVKRERWKNYGEMMAARPVYDGNSGGTRLRRTEFFNRSVQITIRNNSCWRSAWLRLNR